MTSAWIGNGKVQKELQKKITKASRATTKCIKSGLTVAEHVEDLFKHLKRYLFSNDFNISFIK